MKKIQNRGEDTHFLHKRTGEQNISSEKQFPYKDVFQNSNITTEISWVLILPFLTPLLLQP